MAAASTTGQLPHQYVDRASGAVRDERLYQDRLVRFLYGPVREHLPSMLEAVTSRRSTQLLGYLNYDTRWGSGAARRFLAGQGVDIGECLDDPAGFGTPRAAFERRIRFWETRPMPDDPRVVVSPCDARALTGSLAGGDALPIKDKLFEIDELLARRRWLRVFNGGDFAILRLTPEKYHYNHSPVTGRVVDHYVIEGRFHSCNPAAALALAAPYSKNRRVVTVIDSDVPGGTGVGRVAMIEVVALMIGDIEQRVSARRYDDPWPLATGMMLDRGAVKSLFRPGSSTTVLLFERARVRFAGDLVRNQRRTDVLSRYSGQLGVPAAETDIRVRSALAYPLC